MPDLLNVEIFKTGKWNGKQWGKDVLDTLASSFTTLKDVLAPPLKLGHNDEQEVTDGLPALGYATNVRVEGNTLLADFIDVPQIVFNAISKRLYDTLSIEMLHGVKYKGKEFPHVLSGVALLGADLPAVNTLKGLSKYIDGDKSAHSVEGLTFSAVANFSFKNEDKQMAISEEEYNELKAKYEATMKRNTELVSEVTGLEADREKFAAEKKQKEEEEKVSKFNAAKSNLDDIMEQMVKANVLTPGLRDKFSARAKDEETLAIVQEAVEDIKASSKFSVNKNDDQGRENKDDEEVGSVEDPSKELQSKIAAFRSANPGSSFTAAKRQVFTANPKLARAYIEMTEAV